MSNKSEYGVYSSPSFLADLGEIVTQEAAPGTTETVQQAADDILGYEPEVVIPVPSPWKSGTMSPGILGPDGPGILG